MIQECELELTQKGDMVARLQIKASQIGKILQTLENKSNEESHSHGHSRTPSSSSISQLIKSKHDSGPPNKKIHYIDPIPPFNANKIRKSPSGTVDETIKEDVSKEPDN